LAYLVLRVLYPVSLTKMSSGRRPRQKGCENLIGRAWHRVWLKTLLLLGMLTPSATWRNMGLPLHRMCLNTLVHLLSPLLPPMQPFAVDPRTGSRNFPVNLRPDVIGAMGRGEWHNENWQRYERDKEKRGQYVKPPPPGLPPWKFPVTRELPASKVYSDPIPAMFPPGWRPPQPPG